jgi:hypothetical protein
MKKTHVSSLGIAAALALFSSSASAAVVFSTDLESATQATNLISPIDMAGTLATGYTASTLADGGTSGSFDIKKSGVEGNAGTGTIWSQGNYASFQPGVGEIADLAAAIAGNSYYEFTLSNASVFSLESIDLTLVQFGYANSANPVDPETGAYVFTSLTSNFDGTVLASESLGSVVTGVGVAQGVKSGTITLSGDAAFDSDLELYAVTFRVYLIEGYAGTATNRITGIDDISVSVIPEPSAYALLGGLLVFGFAALRRRKSISGVSFGAGLLI